MIPATKARTAPISPLIVCAVILLATTLWAIAYSHVKILWIDEALVYYTLKNHTLAQVLHIQSTAPLVFDPPLFEILTWLSVRIFGLSNLALRLPSLTFFLLAQLFLYGIVSRMAGRAAGCLAMLLLVGLSVFDYSVEARPYSLLLCAALASVFFWMRSADSGQRKNLFLTGLAIALAIASTTHFYGFLAVLPPAIGELTFSLRHRVRPRWEIWLAMSLGCTAALLNLPYLHAVAPFHQFTVRDHSQTSGKWFLTTYSWEICRWTVGRWRRMGIGLAVAAVVILYGSFPRRDDRAKSLLELPVWAAMLTMTLAPVPIFLIAWFVTYTYSPRHAVQCIGGLAALAILAFARLCRSQSHSTRRVLYAVVGTLIVFFAYKDCSKVFYRDRAFLVDTLPPAGVRETLLAHPDQPMYLTADECIFYSLHGDPFVIPHIRCLYSRALEAQYNHQIIVSQTLLNMSDETSFPLQLSSYEEMKQHLPAIVSPHSTQMSGDFDWALQQMEADSLQMQKIGNGFRGEVYWVRPALGH